MRYFDSSILVAALVLEERRHEACARLIATTDDGAVLAHGLAECFALLTGGRLGFRFPPDLAAAAIERNLAKRMKVLTLSSSETLNTLKNAHLNGIRGGAIYDALHLAAARKAGAVEIFTLNPRHFRAFAPDLAERIREP